MDVQEAHPSPASLYRSWIASGISCMARIVSTLLEPLIHWFLAEVLFVLVPYGLVLEARWRNRELRGQYPPLSATRSDHWIRRAFVRVLGAVWSAIRQMFIRLPAPAAITPAALPQSQSATEERLHQSPQSTTELMGWAAGESRDRGGVAGCWTEGRFGRRERGPPGYRFGQNRVRVALRCPALCKRTQPQSQLSATATGEGHQLATEDPLNSRCSVTQDEIQSQPSASEEGPQVVIPEERFTLINIWNGDSLNQGLRNMMDCFKQRNHLIQVAAASSPSSSNSSSPRRYDYTLGVTSVNDENNDRHYEFETLFLLDHGGVDIIDLSSLSQLDDMIHQFRTVQPGYEQILYKVFADNSDVLDGFLCNYFNSASLSIAKWTCMDGSQFTCQLAKSCVMDLKVAAGLLCLMENELAEADCISFHQNLKDCYFALCARRPIENLIGAADSISNLKWSAYHVYQMLVLYEAILDVLRALDNPIESDRIFQQMRVNFEGIFDGIKHVIVDILNDSQFAVTCARHPATDFLVQFMQLLESHNKVVRHICAGNGSSSLGHLLSEVISYWAAELKKHSMSYTKGTNYKFLLNSLSQFQLETKNVLQVLLPNSEPNSKRGEISKLLESLIGQYTSKYLEECWGPLRDCVELYSGRKPHWSSLDEFTQQFNVICNCQKKWQLEPEIKTSLRKQIREFIAPSYDNFLKRLGKNPLSHARLFCQKHMAGEQAKHKTTKELEFTVEELFECVHIE